MLKTGITIYHALRKIVTKAYHILRLHTHETPKGRKEIIENIDAVTLALFKQSHGIATKKSLFKIIAPPCSYKTLVVAMNEASVIALHILFRIMRLNKRHAHLIKYTDATDLPVCLFLALLQASQALLHGRPC